MSDMPMRERISFPKGITVLVVEDNVASFVLMARKLRYMSIRCEWKTPGMVNSVETVIGCSEEFRLQEGILQYE